MVKINNNKKLVSLDIPHPIKRNILVIDNNIKTVLRNSANFVDKDNQKAAATIAKDSTGLKQTEELLNILKSRYRGLFESATDGILIINGETRKIIDINASLIRILGYSKDKYIENEFWNVGLFKDIAANKIDFLELLQKQHIHYNDLTIETFDGKKINAEFDSSIYQVNYHKVIQCNFREFSKHELAEEKIKKSEQRFHNLFENAGIAICDADFSDIKKYNNQLKINGIHDIGSYLENNIDEVIKCTSLVKLIDANKEVLNLLKASEKKEVLENFSALFVEESFDKVKKVLIKLSEGFSHIDDEIPIRILTGKIRKILFQFSIVPGCEETWTNVIITFIDITEKKEIEKALKESVELFRHSFEYAPIGFCIIDITKRFRRINDTFKKMMGYDEIEIMKLTPNDITHPDDLSIEANYTAQLLEGKIDNAAFEKRYIRKDKQIVWSLVYVSLIRDADHNPNFFISRYIDITEQKKSVEQITILAHSLRSINECVSITDMEDKIIFVNESFVKTYGYNENDLLGKNISIVRSLENRQPEINEILPVTISTGWNGELWNRRKDGSEFQIYLSTTTVKDNKGKILGLIGIATDITERKKLQIDLSAAAEIAKLGYWEYEVSSGQFHFNDQYYRLIHGSSTKLKGGDIMNGEDFVKNLVHPADVGLVLKNIQAAIESSDPDYFGETEARVFRDDGSITNVRVQYKIQKDISGNSIKIYGINQDITESKLIEKEFIEAKEKAEEMNRLKTNFLSNMSHELRTPLIGILGYSEILENEPFDEETLEILHIIKNSAVRLNRTINNILEITQIESAKNNINFQEQNIVGFLTNQVRLVKAAAESKGLSINFEPGEKIINAYIDEFMFTSIIENLLSNAVKYTDKGTITLTARQEENSVVIEIKDEGIGVKEELLEKIFEPFRQASEGYNRKYEGTGLGLALVKKYITLMRGSITLRSKPGKGSIFVIKIPIAKTIMVI